MDMEVMYTVFFKIFQQLPMLNFRRRKINLGISSFSSTKNFLVVLYNKSHYHTIE